MAAGARGDGRTELPDGTAAGATDESAELVPSRAGTADDPRVWVVAREIASRLVLPRPRRRSAAQRGSGELASVPFRGGSDELDLDATIEMLAERPVPDEEDFVVRERLRRRRAVVLAVDVSGSMRGERIRTAAAAVGALATELAREYLSVLAFAADATLLLSLRDRVRPQRLLDDLVRVPARGLTNVGFPLQVAARELARVPGAEARVVLLSDCVHNAGPDPRRFAAGLPRLDVLFDVTGEHDADLARDLALAGRGRAFHVRHHRDVAPALSAAFA